MEKLTTPFQESLANTTKDPAQLSLNSLIQKGRKTITVFSQDKGFFRDTSIGELSNKEKNEALNMINDKKTTLEDERNFIMSVEDPIRTYGLDGVNKKIGPNIHERKLLAWCISNKAAINNTSPSYVFACNDGEAAISKFIEQYPSPIEFDKDSEEFLKLIKDNNSPQKYQEYIKDMISFKQHVYGKRQTIFDFFKNHHQESEIRPQEDKSPNSPDLEKISKHESKEIIKHTIINGDPYIIGGQERNLTTDHLKKYGLEPKQKIIIDGVEIALSNKFSVIGRDSVIAYVKTKEGYEARSYYQSGSQGFWRYLPMYDRGKFKERASHLWKGGSEERITLPMDLQKALNNIPKKSGLSEIRSEISFFGTALATSQPNNQSNYNTLEGVAKEPILELSPKQNQWRKTPPEKLILPPDLSPDFSQKIDDFELNSPVYDQLHIEGYHSKDKSLRYYFCEDSRGRAFIGNVEATDSKISPTGLRSNWVLTGEIGVPLYEYPRQDGGYGSPDDNKNGYVSMWDNYLSKIPVIQEFKSKEKK